MIVNELYNGSGLGNQLWRYTVTRVIALNNDYKFGIMNPQKFKAPRIMTLDWGEPVVRGHGPEGGPPLSLPDGIKRYYEEKSFTHPWFKCDCRLYDPKLANVLDHTKIDGNMESEKYLEGHKDQVREWLKINDANQITALSHKDICILGFRGGEYVPIKDLFLSKDYWENAMAIMRQRNPDMQFKVITDDPQTAKRMFPTLDVFHFNTEADWVIVRNARNIIMSNSSFAWIPTWINDEVINVIAPKYWGKHNVSDGFWAQGDSLTKEWEYLDRDGSLFTYEECKLEKDDYEIEHKEMYREGGIIL
jgi:hypothetical protein